MVQHKNKNLSNCVANVIFQFFQKQKNNRFLKVAFGEISSCYSNRSSCARQIIEEKKQFHDKRPRLSELRKQLRIVILCSSKPLRSK